MSRVNLAIVVIAVAALLVVGSAQTSRVPGPPTGQIGRYQLFAGEHPIAGTALTDKAILRIDTVTGRVDEWITGKDSKGNPEDHWYETGIK